MGLHDEKIRVVDSIANITARAVDDLITGIKHSKGATESACIHCNGENAVWSTK